MDNLWITLWITFNRPIRTDKKEKFFSILALDGAKVYGAELSTKLSTGYPQVIHNFWLCAIAATGAAIAVFKGELSTILAKYNNNNL